MTSFFNCTLISFSDCIVSDRRGIVTPEYRAEHEQVTDDNIINNKTYGTAKIVQPQVIINYNVFISLIEYSRYRSVKYIRYICIIVTIYIVYIFFITFYFILIVEWYDDSNEP